MRRNRKQIVDILRCKDGVAVPIKQKRVVDAIRERDLRIAQLKDRLAQAQDAVGSEVAKRHVLLGTRWVKLGIALRMVKP
jgi:hypothetical protein